MKSPVAGWTGAKRKGWIVSLLRRGTMRFPPRNDALRAAKTEKKINTLSGRLAQHYKCTGCKGEFTAKGVVVDHIEPVIPTGAGFTTWDAYIERMFCSVDNLQVMCGKCHDVKSAAERTQRKIK